MEHEIEQPATVETDNAGSGPVRLPPMGAQGHGALPPRHTSPYELETNVSRIATQIALGRPATYD